MFLKLLLLFTLFPLLELAFLLQVHHGLASILGSGWGLLATLLLLVLTGAVGSWLSRQQGLAAIRGIQEALARGELPTHAALDAVLIFMGGVLLLTPGFLSDIVAITFLLPPTRAIYRARVILWLKRQLAEGAVHLSVGGFPGGPWMRPPPGPAAREPEVIQATVIKDDRSGS